MVSQKKLPKENGSGYICYCIAPIITNRGTENLNIDDRCKKN